MTEIGFGAFHSSQLKTVICHSLTPPNFANSGTLYSYNPIFNDYNNNYTRNATLLVPESVLDLYISHKIWKTFGTINGFKYTYSHLSPDKCTLTFYNDCNKSLREGTTYVLNTGKSYPEWKNDASSITKVVFDSSFDDARPKTTYAWFYDFSNLLNIQGIEHLNTSNVTTMSHMFSGCSNLTALDVTNFNTSNVTDMSYMFMGCRSLSSLDLSNFEIMDGTETNEMLSNCSALKSLTVSSSMATINENACLNVGNVENPCLLYVPEGFDFDGIDTSGEYFQWKSGYFVGVPGSMSVTLSSAGIRTYSSSYDLDFTGMANLKAYIVSGFSPSTGELTTTEVTKVPAGEGLLLIGDEGEYNIPIKATDMYYSNLLIGVTTATTIAPTDDTHVNYILANGIHGINFYTLSETGEISANKAYLQLPKSVVGSSANSYLKLHYDDDTNGLKGIEVVNTPKTDVYYDLQGRRVMHPTKGIYIHLGKKVIIK